MNDSVLKFPFELGSCAGNQRTALYVNKSDDEDMPFLNFLSLLYSTNVSMPLLNLKWYNTVVTATALAPRRMPWTKEEDENILRYWAPSSKKMPTKDEFSNLMGYFHGRRSRAVVRSHIQHLMKTA